MAFALFWQRQAIFLATTLLTGYYFNPLQALLFYIVFMVCELQDYLLAKRAQKLKPLMVNAIWVTFCWILVNTVLSATSISAYAVSVAMSQDHGGHFAPLFFLFAAALFAAMNNHQLIAALALRLTIYGISFLVIVVSDLWVVRPPIDSELWLHFFTVVFVMYFLIDCSLVFLKLYRKNLQQLQDLKEEHERTKAAYVAKSQFVSTVSHELRTPLTSIKGSLDLVNMGALGEVPESMRDLLMTAGRNSERLRKLIDDVLDVQKIEAGEMRFDLQLINVQSFLEEAVEANSGMARAHDITLELRKSGQAQIFVNADEMRLMQVVSNMVSNAVKFSHAGGVVSLGVTADRKKTLIYVKDDGVGIPEGSEEIVFGRFSQLDSSDQRKIGGTGLGMNISREIVESFNGKMNYVSQLDRGSTFFVELPSVPPEALDEAAGPEPAFARAAATSS
ncbi:MAG: HAMP domain-containing sensor histidine kinase, partial [Roseovarius sp.]